MKQPIPFGKYYLLERINVGGMAEVFKAKATGVEGFERMVAVKRILPSIAEDEEFITMFVDEAKIAVQLTHANIAQIFDLGRTSESYFIALEFVHGKDLRSIFHRSRQRGEQVPIPMACYVIMKICEGLDYAHNKRDATGQFLNLVHRDVSPQNMLVSYEGEVKIVDFGIAKAAGKAGRTQAGILKGKFGYMSPEQVQQGLEIDRRSDIFGLGICLYETLTGERLFVAETDFATLEKVRKVEIMPPSTYNRRIPEELEQIVLKSLARNRDQRYQTAMELHDELQSFMYTSGNFFGRKDLSMYMQRVFSEELARETTRDREYAGMALPPLQQNDAPETGSGLEAFEEISAISELHIPDAGPAVAPRNTLPPPGAGLPRKATLVGMPAVVQQRAPRAGHPVVPPMTPHAQSIPPSFPVPGAAPPQAPAGDWDDEEMATQIYDKPGEGLDDLSSSIGQGPQPQGAAPAPTPWRAAPVVESDPPEEEKRRSLLIPIMVGVAVLLGVLAGVWLFSAPTPGSLRVMTEPTDAQLKIDGVLVGGVSPFMLDNVEPGKAHLVLVERQGYEPWSIKLQLQPGQRMELPAVGLQPIESGFALDSVPSGATVVVDGKRLDEPTPIRLTDLGIGDHQIRLESEGYAPWESSLQVVEGKVLDLPKAQLTPVDDTAPAAAPQAVVEAPAPAPAPAVQQPRRAAPRARRARRPRAPSPIVAAAPAPVAPRPAAAPAAGGQGTLRVQTRPWSQVFVDGRMVGTTPQMGIKLSAGKHSVTLVNPDFGIKKTISVNVRAGETVTRVLTLTE